MSKSGKIDLMETVGHELYKFLGAIHEEFCNGGARTQKGINIALNKDDWLTFEINWEPDQIQFAVGGQI